MANLRADNLTGTGGRNAIDGSVSFDGGSSLTVADNAGYEFGAGDFTIECWINASDLTHERHLPIIQKGNSATNNLYDWRLYFNNHGSGSSLLYFDIACSGASIGANSTSVFVEKDWIHVAVTRQSGAFKVFFNGNLEDTDSTTANAIDDDYTEIKIGFNDVGAAGDSYLKGFISNLRIIKGTALYTAAFTPPTEKLTAVDGTVLLCCQDSDNPIQEVTGKTITGYGNLAAFSSGDNLVTNGTFDSATTGWTSDGTIAIDSNRLKITNDTTAYRSASQDITVVVGKAYRVSADCIAGTSNNSNFHVGTTSSSNALASAVTSPVVVRPTVTTLRVTLNVGSNTSGHTALYDNVEVREVEPSKAPKVFPPVGVDEGVVFDGDTKINTQSYMYFPTGDTTQRGRGRAVSWWGIYNTSGNYTKDIDYFDIQSLGNTTKFGDLSDTVGLGAGMSSSTRGVFAGGTKPAAGNQNLLEFITIATTGNALDFGGISTLFRYGAGISNSTRGLIAGAYQGSGASGTLNVIQYITIANLGNTLDFGDLVANSGSGIQGAGSCSSSTRGITFGGGVPTTINEINYITIGTLGNSVDFGDLSAARYLCQGVSSSTRGVVAGGDNSGAVNIVEYITIASTGDATDFGDMMTAREHSGSSGGSNGIRGVFVGGGDWPAGNNTMEYITIATTGNTKDFGDSRTAISAPYGSTTVSDCHGGLS